MEPKQRGIVARDLDVAKESSIFRQVDGLHSEPPRRPTSDVRCRRQRSSWTDSIVSSHVTSRSPAYPPDSPDPDRGHTRFISLRLDDCPGSGRDNGVVATQG
jgi:hypothetical protein